MAHSNEKSEPEGDEWEGKMDRDGGRRLVACTPMLTLLLYGVATFVEFAGRARNGAIVQ